MSMYISRWYAYTAKVFFRNLPTRLAARLPNDSVCYPEPWAMESLAFCRSFQLHVAAEVNVIKYKMLKAEITKLFVNDLSCDTL